MTSLPSLLGTLMAVLQAHPLCKRVADIETKEFAPDQFFFKIRAEFTGGSNFQVRIYYLKFRPFFRNSFELSNPPYMGCDLRLTPVSGVLTTTNL